MDRREAILRELNLYPQWKRREQPASAAVDVQQTAEEPVADAAVVPTVEAAAEPARAVAAEKETGREQHIATLDWPELKTMVRDCTACKLRAGCTQTVFGVGDERADWLFVGEGPGADEDIKGEPFVGQAGKLLDNMLMSIRLKRGDNVYIANVVKCRPPGNRTPEADEIATCFPYLQRQIKLIQPKVIVALGKTAAMALLGRDATLGSLRGTVHDYQLPAIGRVGEPGQESSQRTSLPHQPTPSHRVGTTIPLIVTYHPAYLLRSPLEKAKAWEDLCRAVRLFDTAD